MSIYFYYHHEAWICISYQMNKLLTEQFVCSHHRAGLTLSLRFSAALFRLLETECRK